MEIQLMARNRKVTRKVKLEDYKGRKGLKAMNGDWLICPSKFCSLVVSLPAKKDDTYTLHISLCKPKNKNSRCIFILFKTMLNESLYIHDVIYADNNMNVCASNYMTDAQNNILLQFVEYSSYYGSNMRCVELYYWIE